MGSGKKNTKIYKAEHIPTGKYYAIKEVEAKTLDKLNEYKVSAAASLSFGVIRLNVFVYMDDIGGSSATVQGAKPSERAPILWILLLRDDVQHVPYRYGVRIHGQ